MFQFLKNDKSLKKDICLIFLMAIGVCLAMFLLSFVCGCASQAPKVEDGNHYRAQIQQDYPCPKCGFLIPGKDVNPNIRIENTCPDCRGVFFGKPVVAVKKKQGEKVVSSGLKSHGPRSVFEADINQQYFLVGGESFKETETGYSLLFWRFFDRKTKIRRVTPFWIATNYNLTGR